MPDTYSGDVDRLVDRLCREYNDLPGLSLTRRQVRRLCGIDDPVCDSVLDSLLQNRFLDRTPAGTYVRFGIRTSDGPFDSEVPL